MMSETKQNTFIILVNMINDQISKLKKNCLSLVKKAKCYAVERNFSKALSQLLAQEISCLPGVDLP